MSAHDDDDADGGEDLQLKQLRSVWVSMRDEDPPQRGLDALMAAARDKAGEMAAPEQNESWWQRVLAVLRRPPVLALASVTVLLGGALMISQRKDRVEATATATETQERAAREDHAGLAAEEPVPPAMGAGSAAADSAIPAAPADPVAVPSIEKPPANVTTPARPRPRATPRPASGQAYGADTRQPAGKATRSEPEVIGGPAANVGLGSAAPAPPESESTSTTRGPARKQPAAIPDSSTETVEPTLSRDDGAPGERAPTITQLVKQCESAAARNDCAAVKLLARRILSADAAAYKQRVATNSSIARCLD